MDSKSHCKSHCQSLPSGTLRLTMNHLDHRVQLPTQLQQLVFFKRTWREWSWRLHDAMGWAPRASEFGGLIRPRPGLRLSEPRLGATSATMPSASFLEILPIRMISISLVLFIEAPLVGAARSHLPLVINHHRIEETTRG